MLSQIAISSTFLFVFLLGKPVLGKERAFVGTLLLTACYYFGWHTPEFNQDIIEMPFWAGVALALWRAVETGRPIWWLALGFFAAGSIYGKLSAGILLISAALWLLTDARGRKSLLTFGPWIALATFFIASAPLILWLAHGGFDLITHYAVQRGSSKFNALQFIGLQCLMILPMLAVLWWNGLLDVTRASRIFNRNENTNSNIELQRFTRYLLWMTLVPILLSAVAVTIARTGAKLMWGVPMLNLSGLLLVTLTGRDAIAFDAHALRRVVVSSIAIIVASSTGTALTTRYGNQFRAIPDRQNWPAAEIATRMRGIGKEKLERRSASSPARTRTGAQDRGVIRQWDRTRIHAGRLQTVSLDHTRSGCA